MVPDASMGSGKPRNIRSGRSNYRVPSLGSRVDALPFKGGRFVLLLRPVASSPSHRTAGTWGHRAHSNSWRRLKISSSTGTVLIYLAFRGSDQPMD